MKEKFRENLSAIIILLLEAAVGLLLIDPVAFAGTAGEERCFHCGGNLKNGYGAGTPGASFYHWRKPRLRQQPFSLASLDSSPERGAMRVISDK